MEKDVDMATGQSIMPMGDMVESQDWNAIQK